MCVFQFLSEVGFSNVRAEDRTDQFIQVIKTELQRAEEMKEEFIQVNTHTYLLMQSLHYIYNLIFACTLLVEIFYFPFSLLFHSF